MNEKFNELLDLSALGAVYLAKLAGEGVESDAAMEALVAEGYNFEAIKQAFLDNGIQEFVKVAEDKEDEKDDKKKDKKEEIKERLRKRDDKEEKKASLGVAGLSNDPHIFDAQRRDMEDAARDANKELGRGNDPKRMAIEQALFGDFLTPEHVEYIKEAFSTDERTQLKQAAVEILEEAAGMQKRATLLIKYL